MVTAFKVIALFGITLTVGACAHHSVIVKCDGKLVPINVPQAKTVDLKAVAPPAAPAH